MPLHHPLCCSGSEGWHYFASKLFLDLLYCVRLPLAEECGFDLSQQTSFGEVFVCINIHTHIVIGPPPNCPIFLTDYSPSPFCDTHGSVHLIAANWISWTNSTPICTGVPKMTSCPRWPELAVPCRQHQAYIKSPCTQSFIPQSVPHCQVTEGPSLCSLSVLCSCACCKVSIQKASHPIQRSCCCVVTRLQ